MYTCRVKGHPLPSSTWEKDGIAIKETSHFKTSVQGDEHILEILNTTKSDTGNYTCRLHNTCGETSHTATLVVQDKTDFRSLLKTRPTLGKLGKQNSSDSEKSDKENEQLDFRKVLRRGERSTPPGGHGDKHSHAGIQQVDFRNVLKARSEKTGIVFLAKSKSTPSIRETMLKSKESQIQKMDTVYSSVNIDKSVAISEKNVFGSKQSENTSLTKPEIERFEKSSSIMLKKTPPKDNTLKNRLNKYEQTSKSDPSPLSTDVKSQTKRGSLQAKLTKFEHNVSPDESKPKAQSVIIPPKPHQSVLGRLNKFEKLSGSDDLPKKESPFSEPSKPKGNVLNKYSFTEKDNGKSDAKKNGVVPKVSTSEKSLKYRMERFERSSDMTPENGKSSRQDILGALGHSLDTSLSVKPKRDSLTVLTTEPADLSDPPFIRHHLSDQRVKYGHQAVLECAVTSGNINWSVNGKTIRGSKFFKMSMTQTNVAKLTIAEVYSEDEGEYMCTATNKFGSASSTCRLFVEATSSLSSRSDIEGSVTTPARLLAISPSSLAVTRGDKVTIEATFSGDPKPEVRWFKGRDEIQKERRIQIETTADCSILTISNISPDDAGKYIVAIENHATKDSLSASVSIEDIPEPPGKPQANDILQTSIILWWCGSPFDGGSQITHYKVQMKKLGTSDWTTLTTNCKNTFYQVDKLEEKTAYYYHVYAANKHGYSSSGEMSDKIFTSAVKIALDYESDDELPFEPRTVTVDPLRNFEDQYEVMHEVGKGKFGNVYKCKDKESGKIWAAKILKCRQKEKANIRHEIEIMNDLAHPKLMMIWDAFEASRNMTLVMEFVGGGELFERVISDDFELTEGDCVHFMRQICDGVGYMHERGIIHLDLKPENILCISDKTNQVKIIDFGLARRYAEGKSMKVLFGTPEFIAPEVINYDEISFATDMWSLGVICYLLLSGLSPFLGDNDAETLANVTLGTYDFDDESFDDITDNAKDFIGCLLIKTKEKRHLIKPAQQHVWLAQDERRIRNKRLNTDRLKKFMARRKWQVYDHMDDIDSIAIPKDPNSQASAIQDRDHREATLDVSSERETTQLTKSQHAAKKTCSDHNGNIAIRKQNGFNADNSESNPPKFLKEMLDCEAFTGDVIRFDVRVAGSPEPDFHWLHEDEEVQVDKRHIIEVSDKGQCSLIIRNVTDEDDGEYSCIAVNKFGEASCCAELIICSIGAI